MKNDTKISILKYSVIGATSEERDHPLYSIISDNKGDGWSSLRYCSYPQEIIIQLNNPARLTQINLTIHETKIPSKIDCVYFFPKQKEDFNININNIPFIELGSITPNTNEKTNFRAREFKKIQINKNAYFIKFILHKNYINLHNKCNQVGIVNIQCLGINFDEYNINQLCPGCDKSLYLLKNKDEDEFNNNEDENKIIESKMDMVCVNKLREIKMILDECIKNQIYDKAKIYNELYKRVRLLGEKIHNLTESKIRCIETNKLDNCKKIQYDIDRLKEIINNININITVDVNHQ